jgi:1-acyl-sn-glycerol-3-phosphate acyltransferase
MVYPIIRTIFFPLLRFFIKKTVGLANIPTNGPFIIACKHVTGFDGFFLASVLIPRVNQKVHFIAHIKKWGKLWREIVCERWGGVVPFDVNNRAHCLDIAFEHLQRGEAVVIFPEGYLHEYYPDKKPRTGIARLALRARVPIVPVGLKYDITVRNDLPVLYQNRKALINTLFNPHSLEINIGEKFELKKYYNKDITKELLRQATNEVMDKIETLSRINNINIKGY